MSDSMETMSEAIERLKADGYDQDWNASEGGLDCESCDALADPEHVTIDEVVRFEGDSNPDDEAALFALTDSAGHRGLYVTPYGPDATPDDVEVMKALHRRARN